ncbi:hypothetical protein PR202_ga02267 [Eleusine coracana subsp. coracana]|uniref:Uncharacterized protein n=1 Tax=Eleusine coracana subsp. coracana TaxID=191504 RepID=A0AAV5BLR8_ELECO|nr:hypothetical protein PR202_ga02267 [Eleusine coracana subsp. coracana]
MTADPTATLAPRVIDDPVLKAPVARGTAADSIVVAGKLELKRLGGATAQGRHPPPRKSRTHKAEEVRSEEILVSPGTSLTNSRIPPAAVACQPARAAAYHSLPAAHANPKSQTPR